MATKKSLALAFRHRVLNFWFLNNRWSSEGHRPEMFTPPDPAELRRWFGSSKELDQEIKEKFEGDLPRLMNDEYRYENDRAEPEHLLACIITLDQFSRNIFRNDARAFAYDEKARKIASELVDNQLDKQLPYIERAFAYMPFEHSENLNDQNRSVASFEALAAEANADPKASDEVRQLTGYFVKFAKEHRETIERFGRYPHRNLVLKRQTTEAEEKYLTDGGARYGQ